MNSIIVKQNQKKVIPIIWTGEEKEFDYQIKLGGQGADLLFLMLLFGTGGSDLTIRTKVIHEYPDTKSRVIIKGALTDSSRVDFEGLVKIENGAKKSDTWLAAHLLLLSDQAGGKAVPNLEISENDVKAGHATTIGKLNDMELFYLMSRGLTKETSTKLIVQGFLGSLLREFPTKDALSAKKKLKWI